jgi:hypothetical protein
MSRRIVYARVVAVLLLAAVFAVPLCSTPAANARPIVQDEYNLKKVLVGHWRVKATPFVIDDVYRADGKFTSITCDTKNQTKFYMEGEWEVRERKVLRRHILHRRPEKLVWLDANGQKHEDPILVPEWDSMKLEVLDYDRIKTLDGYIAYRVKRGQQPLGEACKLRSDRAIPEKSNGWDAHLGRPSQPPSSETLGGGSNACL